MPFIPRKDRHILDEILDDAEFDLKPDGKLNYFLVALMLRQRKIKGESYAFYKNFIAELRDAADEISDLYKLPYEKKKREENGDIEIEPFTANNYCAACGHKMTDREYSARDGICQSCWMKFSGDVKK